jgi:hypothetical protein
MSALNWLRLVRKVPGLAGQQEMPNLEALIDAEAMKPKDEYHIARWVVPLVLSIVGPSVFIPLTIAFSPLFLIGAIGMPAIGWILGGIFHYVSKTIDPSQLVLRKRCFTLLQRLNSLKNLLGYSPVLSVEVGGALEEAAALYLRTRPAIEPKKGPPARGLFDETCLRAQKAMDDAMAQMLLLAEPESTQAQDLELSKGWAQPLLEEMRATTKALTEHYRHMRTAAMLDSHLSPLVGLRDARSELQRLENATAELEQEVR